MKKLLYLIIVSAVFISCSKEEKIDRDVIYQAGLFKDLLAGQYEGFVKCSEFDKYGDFGIGTIDGLDGEGIELNSEKLTINWQGNVITVPQSATTPFIMTTFFDTDKEQNLNQELDYPALQQYIESLLPDKNDLYTIKISGNFKYLKTRSIEKQAKPYIPLLDVLKDQKLFEFNDQDGTMIGFYIPEEYKDVNFVGYHFHFLTSDKSAGGHVLELSTRDVLIEIDYADSIQLISNF
ncbi:acetolactate decarboxylase [Bacteroidota bacterium]